MQMRTLWYEKAKNNAHTDLVSSARAILADQSTRYSDYERYATLYMDREVRGFLPGQFGRERGQRGKPVSHNVIRAGTNTLVSLVTARKPSIEIVTLDGEQELQDRARGLERLITTVLRSQGVFRQIRRLVRDACLYGDGWLKVWPEGSDVRVRCIHPSRVIVDDNECLDDDPNVIFQREWLTRARLEAMFADAKTRAKGRIDEILANSKTVPAARGGRELVEVWEGWFCIPGQKGRRVICTERGTLADEECDHLPWVHLPWLEAVAGYHGIGIAEELEGNHIEIAETLQDIADNRHTLAAAYWLVHQSTKLKDEHLLTNLRQRMVKYDGNRGPEVETPPLAHPQMLQWPQQVRSNSFEDIGLSMITATGSHPQGMRTGAALMTHQDIQTQRYADFEHRYLEVWPMVGKLILKAGRKIDDWSVAVRDDDFISDLKLKSVDIDDHKFHMGIYPISDLPRQPSAKREQVTNLVNVGMIEPGEGRRLLDLPDLNRFNKLANAPEEYLHRLFDHLLRGGEYVEPLEFMDLPLGLKLGARYWALAQIEGRDQEAIDNLSRWLTAAAQILQPEQPPQPEPGAGAGAGGPPPGAEQLPPEALAALAQQSSAPPAVQPEPSLPTDAPAEVPL